LYVIPFRATARRRSGWPGRISRRPAGRGPDEAAGGPGEAAISLLHSLRRVSESLPGISEDRRAQFSVGLFGADRRNHYAAVSWGAERAGAAVRIEPVRGMRGSVSGEDRHSEDSAR